MNLTEFFTKQKNHWCALTNNTPVLHNLDWTEKDCVLNVYATVDSKNYFFVSSNSIFLLSKEEDKNAVELTGEIASFIASGDQANLNIKIRYPNGDFDIVSYVILQGITRDDTEYQLRHPDSTIIICSKPKILSSYKKPKITYTKPTSIDSTHPIGQEYNLKLDDYLTSIQDKAENLKKDNKFNAYSIAIESDEKGNTIVKHSFNNGKPVVMKFTEGGKATPVGCVFDDRNCKCNNCGNNEKELPPQGKEDVNDKSSSVNDKTNHNQNNKIENGVDKKEEKDYKSCEDSIFSSAIKMNTPFSEILERFSKLFD